MSMAPGTTGALREVAARGVLVSGGFFAFSGLLGLLRQFMLAALLTREDFGLWGIVALSIGTLAVLPQAGIVDRFVQQREADQALAFQRAFTIELLAALAWMVALAATLPVWVLVYDEPELVWPALALLSTLPAAALRAPVWIPYRQMRFLRQGSLLTVEPVVAFVVMIGLAAAGAGWSAIAIGTVVAAWLATALVVATTPIPLRWRFDRSTLRGYWTFSWPLFVAALARTVMAQAAIIGAALTLGLAGAAAVALAATVAGFVDRIDTIVTGTLYPAICAARERTGVLLESFVKSNRLGLMWAMPFGVALALFAADIVRFGIGDRWQPVVVLLQVWGLVAALGHLGFNWTAYLRARGETRPIAAAALAAMLVFLVVGIPLLLAYGLRGLVVGVAAQMLVDVGFRVVFLQRLFGGLGFVRHAIGAATPAVLGAAGVLLFRAAESGGRRLSDVAIEAGVFVAVTATATWRVDRALLVEAASYVRSRPGRRVGII